MGAHQDAVDRRHGRARQRHSRRCARARSDAHPAARERCHQRGMDLRQGAPCLGRAAHPAARPALCAKAGEARSGELGRGLSRHRREAERARRLALCRNCRRPGRRRGDVRAQAPDATARLAEYRLPPGRRCTRSRARTSDLSFQLHHRRHRPGRCDPSRRHRSAPRGARAECAHPQALAPDCKAKCPLG